TNAGTITLESIDQSWSSGLTVTAGTLTNAVGAVINVNNGAGGGRAILANLDNMGTVNINFSATIGPNGSPADLTNLGAFNVASGQTLDIGGEIFNQNAGTLSNDGTIIGTSYTFNLNGGTVVNSGTIAMITGALNFSGGSA